MVKKKTLEKISNLSKISPTFWPLGTAVGITGLLTSCIVLVYVPILQIKIMTFLSLFLCSISIYNWMKLLLENK